MSDPADGHVTALESLEACCTFKDGSSYLAPIIGGAGQKKPSEETSSAVWLKRIDSPPRIQVVMFPQPLPAELPCSNSLSPLINTLMFTAGALTYL